MRFIDKQDKNAPASDDWRTKVSPIPSFLQDADGDDFFLAKGYAEDKRGLFMKGILYTILTATIGVLVGYVISYLMRAPQASTAQALEALVSSVKTQSEEILVSTKVVKVGEAIKGDAKEGAKASTSPKADSSSAASNASAKAPSSSSPSASPASSVSPPAATATSSVPAPAASKASAPPTAEKSKAAPSAVTPAPDKKADQGHGPKKALAHGGVFFQGTNAYGPPPLVEYEIFDESSMLKLEQDPSTSHSRPAYGAADVDAPTSQELFGDADQVKLTSPSKSAFQLQLGAFNSHLNAIEYANRLQEKGYEVNIYEGRGKNHSPWYFVRLNKVFDHVTAIETAKNIHATEKFLPMVVQPIDTERKLR